ncbi:vesicle transport protein Rop [Dorcoceras hygrometricum]|uniref:Vesicle transport protein Rop n=1 Tax=Dorcoceras hygrometricum TaxID=472368 RepID=A0A2Z7CXT8_9LAMI|nr:vesicle transport protein Rop [Dorcoceras hygrometricum]
MRGYPMLFEGIIVYNSGQSTRSVLGKWVYLVTLAMSLFDLQDGCIAIGSLATLDLPMVVDLIGIYVLKGSYYTLTTTNWFLQALSVIPRGSWGDVARRFTMIRWAMRIDGGRSIPVVDRIGGYTAAYSLKCRFPRETGRCQAPRRQQVGSGSTTANPNSGIRAQARILQYIVAIVVSNLEFESTKTKLFLVGWPSAAAHGYAPPRACAHAGSRDGQQLPADACCCSVQVVALLAAAISHMDAPPAGRCPVQWLHGRGLLYVRIDRAMIRTAVPHMLRRARGLLPRDLLAAAAAVRRCLR